MSNRRSSSTKAASFPIEWSCMAMRKWRLKSVHSCEIGQCSGEGVRVTTS
ncbi:hypothetical protein JG688_00010017 [Phytophthora aleatoria]|uniref:Uncharacterized protein n=1 Tax=Phytophthora aleatoria TaxID=2496075 RepID=A0A8J5J5I0_9STRA|nr:hypothetical protein JG688_00010017 [Phytophthora aleatoria]